MAKYQITHTCGHSETVNITGTDVHGERGKYAAYLESKSCFDCARAAQTEAAANAAAAQGLPALTGSDKQIAWAQTIRQKALADVNELAEQYRMHCEKQIEGAADDLRPYIQEITLATNSVIASFTATFIVQASAKWWIDEGRYSSGTTDALRAAVKIGTQAQTDAYKAAKTAL